MKLLNNTFFHIALIFGLPIISNAAKWIAFSLKYDAGADIGSVSLLYLVSALPIILGTLFFGLLFGSLFATIRLRRKRYVTQTSELLDDFGIEAEKINVFQFYIKSIFRVAAIAAFVYFLFSIPSMIRLMAMDYNYTPFDFSE